MSVSISCKYLENKKVELLHGPSSQKFITAAPLDNLGDGSSFSPTDLVAAALGSCIMTTLAIYAERENIALGAMSCSVEKNMSSAGQRRISLLVVRLKLAKPESAEIQTKLDRVAHSCPVHKSLHPETKVDLQIEWI